MKKITITLITIFSVTALLAGCSTKEADTKDSSVTTKTSESSSIEVSSSSTVESSSTTSSSTEKVTLSKDDIYGKQFKGTTTEPQTEITYTFGDPSFDFMEGEVLSYYRNITEPDYEYERTRGMQFENMIIDTDEENYIIKSIGAGSEVEHIFKKIDESTIAWVSEGKEILLTLQ